MLLLYLDQYKYSCRGAILFFANVGKESHAERNMQFLDLSENICLAHTGNQN